MPVPTSFSSLVDANASNAVRIQTNDLVANTVNCLTYLKQGGSTLLPTGCIILWYGSTSTIPAGWALCDGANGTPDLRSKFVIGAGSSYAVSGTGGSNTVTLSVANIPAHTHTGSGTTATESASHYHVVSGTTGNENSTHTHTGTTGAMSSNASHRHMQFIGNIDDKNFTSGQTQYPPGDGPDTLDKGCYTSYTDTNHTHNVTTGAQSASHTHNVDLSSGANSDSHTHTYTFTTSNSVGAVGSAFGIMPPYYALAYIMKI